MQITWQTDLSQRMHKSVEVLREELAGLRTGRASTALLDRLTVEAYGSRMPISQVASLSVPEARLIVVQAWDKGTAPLIAKAIRDAELGLNPIVEGQVIRVPLPELTEQRRKELVKMVHKYSEQSKVTVRNLRREGMDLLKKMEKNKELSKDDMHAQEKVVQEMTDKIMVEVDRLAAQKEADIMQV